MVLTAAEKRAARRARVLQSSDIRLKMLKGQVTSLKTPQSSDETIELEQQLNEGVDELLASASVPADSLTEPKISLRVDPAQRRRQAATRRRRNEQLVQDLLDNETTADEESHMDQQKPQLSPNTLKATIPVTNTTMSRHSIALKLHLLAERLILVMIVAGAIYSAVCMDFQSIIASWAAEDEAFVNHQELVSKGVSIDSIRQHLEREWVEPEMRQKLKHLMTQRLEMDAMSESKSSSGWLPDVADLEFFLSSLVTHPPIVLWVLLVRVLVSMSAMALHKAMKLPDVKNSDENGLGFLVNTVLSSQPVVKGAFGV
ncbi:uncharacterized protein PHALS_08565 [Plasmopara halstedii]|uniref:Transmembrane protein n=1 Tax=Plasmopara halstedii TaxID=4781 RepID=A0A0P1ACC8_PLAHL|nr:uncharacterized protein PHALS_08565 [Plasmopara halstedii]CEG38494.1 hypothetical protein PHALS_08565 [Plasmopara halstedii]|eukprot:XP_024574863.1 hypothetical protein PHALS_08565 [Plasmopara halstedii]